MADQVVNSRGDSVQQANLGDHTLVSVKLDWRLGSGPVTVYIGANNLLDEEYQESFDLPRAGRIVYVGLRAGF